MSRDFGLLLPSWREAPNCAPDQLGIAREIEYLHMDLRQVLPLVAHRPLRLGPLTVVTDCPHTLRSSAGRLPRDPERAVDMIREAKRRLLADLAPQMEEEEIARKELLALAPSELFKGSIARVSELLRAAGINVFSTPVVRAHGRGPEEFRIIDDGYESRPSYGCVSFRARLAAWREMEAIPAIVEALQQATPYVPLYDGVIDLGSVQLTVRARRRELDIAFTEPVYLQQVDTLKQRLAIEVPAAILAGRE